MVQGDVRSTDKKVLIGKRNSGISDTVRFAKTSSQNTEKNKHFFSF